MGARELVFNECKCTHLDLELPSEILDEESETCRSLFSLLDCFTPDGDFLPDLHFDQVNIN